MEDLQEFTFHKNGYFHQMIGTYGGLLSGTLLFNDDFYKPIKDIRTERKEDVKIKLNSKFVGETHILPHTTYIHLKNGLITWGVMRQNLIYMLLNICYENIKDVLSKEEPNHEFFRHLRNAASHGGIFTFNKKEPIHPANWRGIELNKELDGKRIWDLGIGEGDILLLLWDVEQGLMEKNGIIPETPIDLDKPLAD